MSTPPDTIRVVFCKQDTQTCGPYRSNKDCLLATALKRMKIDFEWVFGDGAMIGSHRYEMVPAARQMLASNKYPLFENEIIVLTKVT